MKEKKRNIEREDFNEVVDSLNERFLILHNDEENTFDFVIDSLIEVCEHNMEQAEQCTLIVHYKGKCDVKKGNFEKLKPMKDQLVYRGLTATID